MPPPNKLQVHCAKCKVSETCPRKGSSPTKLRSGKQVFCRIVGGYGRIPIPESKLSPASRESASKDGPCLTIAEVPTIDDPSGKLYFEIVKVWSQPIRHPRETTTLAMDRALGPSAHRRAGTKPRH